MINHQELSQSQEMNLDRKTFKCLYMSAVQNPTATRHRIKEQLRTEKAIPISYSNNRKMHVLSRNDNPNGPVVAVANAGCFEFNSANIYGGIIEGNEHPDILDADEGDGPMLYAFTKPEDTFVIRGTEERMLPLLQTMNESFAAIGISLSENIELVSSLTKWLRENKPDNMMPHVLSPRSLYEFARDDEERYRYGLQALLHTTLYSKRGFQEFCKENGIPTPQTIYDYYEPGKESEIAENIVRQFGNYPKFVVTKDEGVGGHGVFKGISIDQIRNGFLGESFNPGETVMTQRHLPLLQNLSPCTRYYVGPDRTPYMMGSTVQRFLDKEGSQYGGNKWHTTILDELDSLAPGFEDHNKTLATKLAEEGYCGIWNVDDLLIDPHIAHSIGEEVGSVKKRELNARPAMSHWLSIIGEEGIINGKGITRVHTKTSVIIPSDIFYDTRFIPTINSIHPDVRVLVGTRYVDSMRTYLAFAGSNDITEEELGLVEDKILSMIC